jgi:hypothetical protein
MCNCINIEVGSYGNQVELSRPPHMPGERNICVDVCLKDEILNLWSLGITTTGCCCGHKKVPPFIGVEDVDIPRMKELGYKVQFNNVRPGDEDGFIPKTV